MSNFSEKQKNADVHKMELSMHSKQIELEYRSKCVQWAIQTAPPQTPSVIAQGVDAGQKRPATPEEILAVADKYYEFLDSMGKK